MDDKESNKGHQAFVESFGEVIHHLHLNDSTKTNQLGELQVRNAALPHNFNLIVCNTNNKV